MGTVLNIEPGCKLDVLVAERIFGYTVYGKQEYDDKGRYQVQLMIRDDNNPNFTPQKLPEYSTSIRAFDVIEHLWKKGSTLRIEWCGDEQVLKLMVSTKTSTVEEIEDGVTKTTNATNHIALVVNDGEYGIPEAICKAALLAVYK